MTAEHNPNAEGQCTRYCSFMNPNLFANLLSPLTEELFTVMPVVLLSLPSWDHSDLNSVLD